MLTVRRIPPAPDLARVVRHYQIADARLPPGGIRLPMTARADQFLEFYLEGRHRIVDPATGDTDVAPAAVAVGPQTRRGYDLLVAGRARWFTIHFAHGGLHRLLGVPMTELADRGIAADAFAGHAAAELAVRLVECADDDARVACAEAYVRRLCRRAARTPALVSAVAAGPLADGRDVAAVARAAGMSVRQLERRFAREVGLAPKLFSRVARLQRALAWRERHPTAAWAEVASMTGYHDQMHLVRDFRALAGDSPTRFERALPAAARRLQGTPDDRARDRGASRSVRASHSY